MAVKRCVRCVLFGLLIGMAACSKPEKPAGSQPSGTVAAAPVSKAASPTTSTTDSPRTEDARLVPLDLTPGGLCLTIKAPRGAAVKPTASGVVVRKGEGFQLAIRPDDGLGKLRMKRTREMLRQPGVDVIEDKENSLIGGSKGFGQEAYQCCIIVVAGGKPYVCTTVDYELAGRGVTKTQVVLMAECAKSLTQTEANKQAAARMQHAIDRFNSLDCKFMPAFNHLTIMGSSVTDADMALARDLPQTNWAIISARKLTPAGLKHLQALPNLDSVSLEGKAASDAWLAQLKPLRLRRLWLRNTSITSKGWLPLKELATLEELKIREQAVPDAVLQYLSGMPSLHELHLQNTGTTNTGLKHLRSLKNLGWLEITDNPVTDAGLEDLAALKDLSILKLGGTKVTKAGVDKLKKLLPGCQISTDDK